MILKKIKSTAIFLRNLLFVLAIVLSICIVLHDFLFRAAYALGLEMMVGAPVTVQKAELDIFKGRLTLSNVQISNPHSFPKGILAKIPVIAVQFDEREIWKGKLHIDSLEVEVREVHVLRNAQGRFNWFALKTFGGHASNWEVKNEPAPDEAPFFVRRFILSLGQATYTDYYRAVPYKTIINLQMNRALYMNLYRFKDILRIIGWETLIRMDKDELAEPFRLMEGKIESVLGKRRDYMLEWRRPDAAATA